ncbi:MAG TPA: AarF/ABC1/UbiB kinase family protein [Firmicutes bacterium]|nr:AarF/ABC1/UbiB kinase family protein [Bacillota bacterium]
MTKHGLGFALDYLGWRRALKLPGRGPTGPTGDSEIPLYWQRVRAALEELGPTFIKLGQIMSTRGDILPRALVAELRKLQDRVPPVDFSLIAEEIERELGSRPDQVFAWIEEVPLAAASIGQVHRARLPAGEEVVVKVQRPRIESAVEVDLEILVDAAGLLESRFHWAKAMGARMIAMELAESLRRELDFRNEAAACERFARDFRGDDTVVIPRVYWDYTTRRLLVLERVEGVRVADIEILKARGLDRLEIARRIVRCSIKQILRSGFFHADLHPGNVVVLDQGRIALIDFGIVGELDPQARRMGMDIMRGVLGGDPARVARALIELSPGNAEVDEDKLARDVAAVQERYQRIPVGQLSLREFLPDIMGVCFSNGIRLRGEFALLMRALITLEGLLGTLSPEVAPLELVRSSADDILRREVLGEKLRSATAAVLRYAEEFLQLPLELQEILRQLRRGEVKLKHETPGLERAARGLQLGLDRLSFSIILAGITVGSALVAGALSPPVILGIPVAEVGFAVAVVLGIWLIVSIFRSGRL